MGYSKHPRAILRVENHLKLMLESNVSLQFEADDANRLRHYLHEAINLARSKANDPASGFSKYATLASKYKLRLKGNKVVAELRDGPPIEVKLALKQMTFEDLTDSLEAIGALIEHKPDVAYFPDFDDESGEEKQSVLNWCEKNGYVMETNMMTDAITVKKNAD